MSRDNLETTGDETGFMLLFLFLVARKETIYGEWLLLWLVLWHNRFNVNQFARLQTLSRLFQLLQIVKCWQIFLEFNSKRLYQSSGKEKESRCLVFMSSRNVNFWHFLVVVMQRRQKMYKKRDARAKLLFCEYKPIAFFAVLVAVAVVVA